VVARYGAAAGEWQMVSALGNKPFEYYAAATANNIDYTATPAPAYAALAALDGKRFTLRIPASGTNSGAATLNLNGLGALPVYKNFNQPLAAGDWQAGQMVEVCCNSVTGTQAFQMLSQVGNTPVDAVVVGLSRDLVIKNDAIGGKLDVTASEVCLRNAVGLNYMANNVNLVLDTSLVSYPNVNGYDAAWVSAAWYYVWLIYNPSTSTVAGLLSLSATAPTLPSGYTFKAMVGAVRATAATTLAVMYQNGRDVAIADTNVFTAKTAASAATWALLAGADLTTFQGLIPPIARACSGTMGSSANQAGLIGVASDTTGLAAQWLMGKGTVGTQLGGFDNGAPFRLPLTTQNLAWQSLDNTTARNRLNVSGYSI
jgi:hypothetical protein